MRENSSKQKHFGRKSTGDSPFGHPSVRLLCAFYEVLLTKKRENNYGFDVRKKKRKDNIKSIERSEKGRKKGMQMNAYPYKFELYGLNFDAL